MENTTATLPESPYTNIIQPFAGYHQDELNVLLHLITTPIGIIGALSLLNRITRTSKSIVALCAIYTIALVLDNGVSLATSTLTMCIMISCAIIAAKMNMNIALSILTLAAGYGLQDLAHYHTGEATFHGATWGSGSSPLDEVISMFTMHVYYLLPLVLDVASDHMRYVVALSPLMVFTYGNYFIDSHCTGIPHTFQKDRMMKGNLSSPEERASLECIRNWAISQNPPKEKTSHWWVADLGKDAHDAFERIEHSVIIRQIFQERFNRSDGLFSSGYKMDVVRGMNEVYISGPNRKGTSDEVFFTEHIDGPYGFFPFASLYRCILGLDMNTEISTIFTAYERRETVQTGDFVAFDFHREPHLIVANNNAPNKDSRIVLKLHYVVYPSSMAMFGNMLHWMTVKYNEAFRALFLYTLTPTDETWSAFVGEYLVNGFTKCKLILDFMHLSFFRHEDTKFMVFVSRFNFCSLEYGTQAHWARKLLLCHDSSFTCICARHQHGHGTPYKLRALLQVHHNLLHQKECELWVLQA